MAHRRQRDTRQPILLANTKSLLLNSPLRHSHTRIQVMHHSLLPRAIPSLHHHPRSDIHQISILQIKASLPQIKEATTHRPITPRTKSSPHPQIKPSSVKCHPHRIRPNSHTCHHHLHKPDSIQANMGDNQQVQCPISNSTFPQGTFPHLHHPVHLP